MVVDNLISKNDIIVNGQIIADVSGTAKKALYDTKGRKLSSLKVTDKNTLYTTGKYGSTTSKTSDLIDQFLHSVSFNLKKVSSMGSVQNLIYANGKFATVSYNSQKIAYADIDDIEKWTQASVTSIGTNGQNICYGGGKYIVCDGDKVYYSTSLTGPYTSVELDSNNWHYMAYGNGIFVVFTYNTYTNYIFTSTNGSTWTKTSLPCNYLACNVCFGGGKFIAKNYSGHDILYSTDGINWTLKTLSCLTSGVSWNCCYGNGKHVAIINGTHDIAYSTDGINWNLQVNAVMTNCSHLDGGPHILYGDGIYFLLYEESSDACDISISYDAINWIQISCVGDGLPVPTIRGMVYADGKFIAYNNNGDIWIISLCDGNIGVGGGGGGES